MTIAPYVAREIAPYAGDLIRQAGSYLYNRYGNDILAQRKRAQQEWISSLTTLAPTPYYARKARATNQVVTYNKPRMLSRYSRRKRIPINRTTLRLYKPRVEIKADTEDDTISATSSTTGLIGQVSLIAAGTGVNDRNGTCIKALDIKWILQLTKDAGADAYIHHRCIFFIWNQNWTSPSVSAVLETGTIDGLYNTENARVFRILSDKTYTITSGAGVAAAYAPGGIQANGYAKINTQMEYEDTSTGSADRSIYCILISSSVNGHVNVSVQTRFHDI